MNPYRNLLLSIFLPSALSFLLFVPGATVQAQTPVTATPQTEDQESSDGSWHVVIAPYLWLAGVHGTVGARGREAGVHASFGDVLSNVDIGAMGAIEVRYNRIIIPVDFMWIKLSDDKAIPFNVGPTSIKAKMTQAIFTPKIGYRLIDEKRIKVDALFGIRYWHLTNDLTLQPTQPLGGFSASANWVDAVAGAKFAFVLTPKVVVTVLGDAGAGGANSDYQIAGLFGYRIGRKWILQAGYRYVSVNYRPQSTFVYDVAQSGLVLGATINLK